MPHIPRGMAFSYVLGEADAAHVIVDLPRAFDLILVGWLGSILLIE